MSIQIQTSPEKVNDFLLNESHAIYGSKNSFSDSSLSSYAKQGSPSYKKNILPSIFKIGSERLKKRFELFKKSLQSKEADSSENDYEVEAIRHNRDQIKKNIKHAIKKSASFVQNGAKNIVLFFKQ